MKKIIAKSEKETRVAGEKFAEKLKPGNVVFLYGDLGYGKTTFVKGVAVGLGIKSRIISPTFTIIRQHRNFYHIDLYRIEEKDQLEGIGITEVLKDSNSIKLIEWPEKLERTPDWSVKFHLNTDDTRTINIIKHE